MAGMSRTRSFVFAFAIVAAMFFGGLFGAVALAHSVTPASAALTATTPSPAPGFRSNETPAHEAGESASREAAENNGTFHPGGFGMGPGGHPCGGHSNEDPTHEKSETAAQEAAENAACPAPSTSTATPTK